MDIILGSFWGDGDIDGYAIFDKALVAAAEARHEVLTGVDTAVFCPSH